MPVIVANTDVAYLVVTKHEIAVAIGAIPYG
jgi:hypothetical protein